MQKTTVLVTGATGFIGSHVVRSLLEKGGTKVVATNASGSARNLEDVMEQVEIVRADIGSLSNVLRVVKTHRPKTIYHLGAMLGPSCDTDPEAGIRTNALGTYYILEAARLFGVKQVIFASSMSIFTGGCSSEPVLNDFSVTRPDFVYGAAKLFSENIGLFFKRQYGFDYRGLRLPNIIGPGTQTHGYLEYFNKAIEESANGHSYSIYVAPHVRIPIMYIHDAARAFLELAQAPLVRIKTTNYIILGPTPSPTAQDLVHSVTVKIPGARLDFQVDATISRLIESDTRLANFPRLGRTDSPRAVKPTSRTSSCRLFGSASAGHLGKAA
jgi:nucleoside-diphosphate-sugar epimerase